MLQRVLKQLDIILFVTAFEVMLIFQGNLANIFWGFESKIYSIAIDTALKSNSANSLLRTIEVFNCDFIFSNSWNTSINAAICLYSPDGAVNGHIFVCFERPRLAIG